MKTIILAGGFSTRLYPKTEFFPKSLLQIKGKEIVKYLIEDLLTTHPESIVLVSNSRYFETFESWLKKNYPRVILLNNGVDSPASRLGAIGDILFALNNSGWQDDILVLSSDTLSSLKLKDFLKFYESHRGVINAVFDTKNPEIIKNKLGCVKINADSEIVEFEEKPVLPKSTLTSIPYYIFPKETVPLINKYKKEGGSLDTPGSIIHWLIGKVPIFGYEVKNGYYFDVGTLETYSKLENWSPTQVL